MGEIENIPREIVSRLLERGHEVAARAARQAEEFSAMRGTVRQALAGVIERVPDNMLDAIPSPVVAAVDGGMVCESRSIGDFCTAVGVAVGPNDDAGGCDIWMETVPRAAANKEILGGIMSSMEVRLAVGLPGDVVMVDGAMLSTFINVSKSIYEARSAKATPLSERALENASTEFRRAVIEILTNGRFVAVPKYTTTNEFAALLPASLAHHDARTIATMALRPGEMTHFKARPPSGADRRRQLIGPALGFVGDDAAEFAAALDGIQTCYYRPHPWTPAFRLDMTAQAADGPHALRVLRAVRDWTRSSGLREPFPLYLADLFAKHVSVGAAPIVEMASLSSLTDPDARLLVAMGYRS
jgi:NurA domain.